MADPTWECRAVDVGQAMPDVMPCQAQPDLRAFSVAQTFHACENGLRLMRSDEKETCATPGPHFCGVRKRLGQKPTEAARRILAGPARKNARPTAFRSRGICPPHPLLLFQCNIMQQLALVEGRLEK